MIGVGVIGAGVMGAAHVATLANLGGVQVVAVSDPDTARAERAAAQVGAKVLPTPEALIADPSVQAVLIVSPDEHHAEQVLAALALNKPVLCEKPLAATMAEAEAILRADAGRGLVQVGYMRRFDPDYADLKAHLQSGVVGMPLLLRMIHRNGQAPAFMKGAQGLTNSMVHEFDILRWLTGDEITRIRVSVPPAAPRGGLIDPLLATVETDSGLLVEIENSANVRYGYDVQTEILGTEGTLRMAERPAALRLTGQGAVQAYPADFTLRFVDAYRLQFTDWITALKAGEPRGKGASAWDGAVAMAIAEAGVRALHSGDWAYVVLPEQRNAA